MADEKVGFIGIGRMGEAIARNLREAGHELVVYNRTASKADALVREGAARAQRPADACSPGGVVITMLSDDRALEEVVGSDGFLARLAPGGVHVSMSTVSPETTERLAIRHANEGSALVAAPVFGRPAAAAARKLWICVSGAPQARDRAVALLRPVGQGIFEMGDDPSAASVTKLCGNFVIAAAMESMAEAFALGEKNGVAPSALADLFGKTMFSCPAYQSYGATIAERRFTPPGFTLALGLKDLNLAVEAGSHSNVPMPFAQIVRDRLRSGVEKGRGDLDWAALTLGAREDAGL
ncbi:MAG TPA: NAD(P)-dependent oxidoreductase [Thermoanaerobaculia bacterium]|nr:NAD(P)-dependent oxidoreductase [Thermoanaerobaculia bacterium]